VDVIAARPLAGPDRSNDLREMADSDEAAGSNDGGRTGIMESVIADATIRVDASVDGVALRRVLAALVVSSNLLNVLRGGR
jgi:hypothetical protein